MKYKIKEIIPYIIILIVVVVIKTYIVTPVKVVGTSMVPTLKGGEIMLLDKLYYKFNEIKRFDIVVVHHHDSDIIKRVIALPNETVEFKDNALYINGNLVDQPFSFTDTFDFTLTDINEIIIPEGYYFVVGDNRINSTDSRMIGLIDGKLIKGKASFTIFPFKNFGLKK